MVQVGPRSQRRMEKKQALILLLLILAVSLVSFSLGVMVGKGGQRPEVQQATAVPERLPVARPANAPPAAPVPAKTETGGENLTFFDTLPKGEQPPLGSGINLPPSPSPAASADKSASSSVAAPKATAATSSPATSAPAQSSGQSKTTPAPSASVSAPAAGAYIVQAASFQQSQDALNLRDSLARKGYAVYTQEADLGDKGVWHRVYVGPLPDSAAAEKIVARLQAEEKLTGLVRRR